MFDGCRQFWQVPVTALPLCHFCHLRPDDDAQWVHPAHTDHPVVRVVAVDELPPSIPAGGASSPATHFSGLWAGAVLALGLGLLSHAWAKQRASEWAPARSTCDAAMSMVAIDGEGIVLQDFMGLRMALQISP